MDRTSAVDDAARAVDRALSEIERVVGFLLHVTPVNAADAWEDFERGGYSTEPMLRSRPLEFDPDALRLRLYELPVAEVEDLAIGELLNTKRDELARQITLLADRDTSRFIYGSLQLFGEVSGTLMAKAGDLLEQVQPEGEAERHVTASAFAEEAQAELDRYAEEYPGFDLGLDIRTDVSDLMVLHGRLLIPADVYVRSRRVDPLIHHEVGTHMLTYANGRTQPLTIFATGLPGYEETQEGLALLAEYLVGGLDPVRLRVLAARVIAVGRVIEGAGFQTIFDELHEEYGFHPRTAWSIAIRVTRGGGFTKDVIYLRGIERLLEFAEERRNLEPLLVGKLSLGHVALVEDLIGRGILRKAWLRPHWLEAPGAQHRLERVFEGIELAELVESEAAA